MLHTCIYVVRSRYLLYHTESSQAAAERRFALPADYDRKIMPRSGCDQGDDGCSVCDQGDDDCSMDQNHSINGDSSDDATAGIGGFFCHEDEDVKGNWGPSAARERERHTHRGAQPLQSEAASLDLATATRLNSELQSQLAVNCTLMQTHRLAAQTARNRSFAEEKQAPERRERHSIGASSRWDTGEVVPAAPHNLEDAIDELRTALTVANAARRAAEDTIAHMTSTATGTERQQFGSYHMTSIATGTERQQSGSCLGSAGLPLRTTLASDRWTPNLGTHIHFDSYDGRGAQLLRRHSQTDMGPPRSHQSGVQLHEVVRQRWASRQDTRRW